jgi:BolA protein
MNGGSTAAALRSRLAALAPTVLELHDDSAEHRGHAGAAGGGGHFSLLIVSESFSGLRGWPVTSACCAKLAI